MKAADQWQVIILDCKRGNCRTVRQLPHEQKQQNRVSRECVRKEKKEHPGFASDKSYCMEFLATPEDRPIH